MAAPLLCIGVQFGLHFLYGREYILYSPNWHGAVCAVWVGAIWIGLPGWRRSVTAGIAALSAALALNGAFVMDRVYREVEAGLEASLRDGAGRLKGPLP